MIPPNLLDGFVTKTSLKPSRAESVRFFFFEKGIDLISFNNLPLPYILEMIKVNNYIKEQEERELKKQRHNG